MHSFLRVFRFIMVLNSVLPSWRLLVFEFLLGVTETLLCLVSAPHAKSVPLLDVNQLLRGNIVCRDVDVRRIRSQERYSNHIL
jgi:hypothetical protein